MAKIVLRVAAAPLTAHHVTCMMANVPGSGFSLAESGMTESYHGVAVQAAHEAIEQDAAFAAAIQGLVFKPLGKPISRLNPRNQFLAMAPALTLCSLPTDSLPAIAAELLRPFVLSFDSKERLDAVRRLEADPATGYTKLAGFVEQHAGCVAFAIVE